MSPITSHVLDTTSGQPAVNLAVSLETRRDGSWRKLGEGATDQDGRVRTLLPDSSPLREGAYRLVFDTAAYFETRDVQTFYPRIIVEFTVSAADAHYHVPLLLSPYGYTTYRGT